MEAKIKEEGWKDDFIKALEENKRLKKDLKDQAKKIFVDFRKLHCDMCGSAIYCADGETVCQEFIDLENKYCD